MCSTAQMVLSFFTYIKLVSFKMMWSILFFYARYSQAESLVAYKGASGRVFVDWQTFKYLQLRI